MPAQPWAWTLLPQHPSHSPQTQLWPLDHSPIFSTTAMKRSSELESPIAAGDKLIVSQNDVELETCRSSSLFLLLCCPYPRPPSRLRLTSPSLPVSAPASSWTLLSSSLPSTCCHLRPPGLSLHKPSKWSSITATSHKESRTSLISPFRPSRCRTSNRRHRSSNLRFPQFQRNKPWWENSFRSSSSSHGTFNSSRSRKTSRSISIPWRAYQFKAVAPKAIKNTKWDSRPMSTLISNLLNLLKNNEDRMVTTGGNMGKSKWKEAKIQEATTSVHSPIARQERTLRDHWMAKLPRLFTGEVITIPSL